MRLRLRRSIVAESRSGRVVAQGCRRTGGEGVRCSDRVVTFSSVGIAVSARKRASVVRGPRSGTRRFRSSGVPSATIRPLSSTAIRSASSSASSRYCVVSRIVTPAATSSRTICHTLRRPRGSRPVVGSSRKMTAGLPMSVIARSSRRLIPPEYVDTGLSGRLGQVELVEQLGGAPPSLGAAEVVQIRHQQQVFLTGQQVVHGGELAGDTDRRADPRQGRWRGRVRRPGRRRRRL